MIRMRSDLVCIESPRARGSSGPWDFACRPDAMVVKTGSANDEWPGNAIEDELWGWYIGDPMPCLRGGRVWRDPNGSYDDTFGEYGLYESVYGGGAQLEKSGLARMGDGRKAYQRQWLIPCSYHGEYRMKIWHLPQSKVSFFVLAARDDDAPGHRRH